MLLGVVAGCAEVPSPRRVTPDSSAGSDDARDARVIGDERSAALADSGIDALDTAPAPVPSLCDGADGISFAYRIVAPSTRVYPGKQVLYELGAPFLFVDGHCNYWVSDSRDTAGSAFSEYRHGVLDDHEERALADRAHLADWSRLHGVWSGTWSDAAAVVVYTRDDMIVCARGCDASNAPAEVADLGTPFLDTLRAMYSRGTALSGPLRFMAVGIDPALPLSYPVTFFDWTFDPFLADVALTTGEAALPTYGRSILFAGPSGLGDLRRIRSSYLAGDHGAFMYFGYLPAQTSSGDRYEVYVRDSLPFEDEHGLVPLPHRRMGGDDARGI